MILFTPVWLILVSMLAALGPAWQAGRLPIAATLREE